MKLKISISINIILIISSLGFFHALDTELLVPNGKLRPDDIWIGSFVSLTAITYLFTVYVIAKYAASKSRSFGAIFILGLLLTPLTSLIVAFFLSDYSKQGTETPDSSFAQSCHKYYSTTGKNILINGILLSLMLSPFSAVLLYFTHAEYRFLRSIIDYPTLFLSSNMVLALLLAIYDRKVNRIKEGFLREATQRHEYLGESKRYDEFTNTETSTRYYRERSEEELNQAHLDLSRFESDVDTLEQLGSRISKYGWGSERLQVLIIFWSLWAIVPIATAHYLVKVWLID